jgi:hypothetical protein
MSGERKAEGGQTFFLLFFFSVLWHTKVVLWSGLHHCVCGCVCTSVCGCVRLKVDVWQSTAQRGCEMLTYLRPFCTSLWAVWQW